MRVRFTLLLLLGSVALAQEPARAPLTFWSPVQDKNFYLLSLFERTDSLKSALETESALNRIRSSKLDSLKSVMQCKPELICYTRALMWTDEEIATVERSLRDIYHGSSSM